MGHERPPLALSSSQTRMHHLPDSYAIVPAIAFKNTDVAIPKISVNTEPTNPRQNYLDQAMIKEKSWVDSALLLLEKEELAKEDKIVWGAHHALQQPPSKDPPSVCALLPLFYEKAATPSMIKHGMDVQRQAIAHLSPGQIPVTTMDQPLFALAKLVQWKWPSTHGEHLHVVMLGGLHTEMALWNTLGDVLEASGWTAASAEAEIASSGVADSFLRVTHLMRTRHAHEVTVLTLQKLQQEAYLQSKSNASFPKWKSDMCKGSPTFMYWDFILRCETLVLIFVRAHRERNFQLYLQVLEKLTPLFFALDHVNYARWMPVHIRDMKNLPDSIRNEFERQGHWVLSKTNNSFSAIPVDQGHEQENASVKGSGGCIGLTENPIAFRRWMISGPELARLQKQFEVEYQQIDDPEDPRNFQNHQNGYAMRGCFQKQVRSLCSVFKEMGNPFLDDFPELVTLDSRNCMDESVVNSLCSLEDTGEKQYQEFVKTVFEDFTRSIHDPIKRNSLALFKRPQPRKSTKLGKKIADLQNNVALFGQLYISMQNRDGDLKEFFSHEIQSFPPSLSDFGKLHLPNTKSELLKCIELSTQPEPLSSYDCIILDGAVLVHCLPTTGVITFNDYAEEVFIP